MAHGRVNRAAFTVLMMPQPTSRGPLGQRFPELRLAPIECRQVALQLQSARLSDMLQELPGAIRSTLQPSLVRWSHCLRPPFPMLEVCIGVVGSSSPIGHLRFRTARCGPDAARCSRPSQARGRGPGSPSRRAPLQAGTHLLAPSRMGGPVLAGSRRGSCGAVFPKMACVRFPSRPGTTARGTTSETGGARVR
jgi:hypothetical protein